LSVLPKLLEKLIEPKISYIFKTILSDNQHGFRKTKSTLTNLMTSYSDLLHLVIKGVQVDAIYTDIKKAFDTVNIDILINKLNFIGVRDPILSWFKSYLSDRIQQVKIGNSIS
jgi:hypothetical protein